MTTDSNHELTDRDPDDSPDTLWLTVESYDEARGRVLDAIVAVEEGEKEP